ncbi:MAG: 6-bladed beta-propeller, partial [Calditrichaeota bacterium]|nr:6-bladed beta-propeller [Calditrichota bacterium]
KQGRGAGEFWLPAGIYIDAANRIYVADTYNSRIQMFQLVEGAEDEP